jgi:hypothetical protein
MEITITPPLPTGQKTQKNRTHDQALHHLSPLVRKLKRTEPTTKHYVHHSFPLAIKLKRTKPTTKHNTTPPHRPENSKEPTPRPSTTPPLPTGLKTQKNRTHDQISRQNKVSKCEFFEPLSSINI